MIYECQCSSTTKCEPITIELFPGRYLLECYGAEGGTGLTDSKSMYHGGYGSYASGILNLNKKTTFFLYIGGKGEDGVNNHNVTANGGWNGGGNSGKDTGPDSEPDTPGGGGGSTDIRLIKAKEGEESTYEESLNSRIIVAAGGSGSCFSSYGAPGGDLTGYVVTAAHSESYTPSNTTQETGFQKGRGENGTDYSGVPSSGSGGGYYGGEAGKGTVASTGYQSVSSSGSSYVAGFPGCPKFTNELGNVFGFKLTNPHISNGFSIFSSIDESLNEKGHQGNGAIKITRLLPYIRTQNSFKLKRLIWTTVYQ